MPHSAKCPHCGKVLTYIGAEAVEIKVGPPLSSNRPVYKGVTYFCPTVSGRDKRGD